MALKTIMSPAKDELYPLRISDVRVAQGEIVAADTVALVAETARGQRIAIKCAQAGRVTHRPSQGALFEKREMLLVIETFADAASKAAPDSDTAHHSQSEQATETAQATAYANARGQQERIRRETATPETAPTPEEPTVAAPGKEAKAAGPDRKGRVGKLMFGGAIVIGVFAGLYALTYTDAFGPAAMTPGSRTRADVTSPPTGWMNAPAIPSPDTFTYKAPKGARFFGIDVDSRGNTLLVGRIASKAILCAFTFDVGKTDCSASFRLPLKSEDTETSDDGFGAHRDAPHFNSLAKAYEAILGKNSADANTTYPDHGFVIQDAFANGDALAGFTPAPSDQPSTFYRYSPADKRMTRLDDLAIEARYVAVGRSGRYVAMLGQQIWKKRQALLLLDHDGNSDTVHIEQKWTPAGGNEILESRLRTFTQISVAEDGNTSPRIDLGGETDDNWGGLIFTRIPFEGSGDGLQIITKVKTRTTNAKRLLPEKDSDRYVYNRFELTASAHNPATGVTASAAAMVAKLAGPQKYRINSDGKTRTTDMRGDVLLLIETADGEMHRRTLVRGGEFPGAGLKVTRITPLPDGRFALLLREVSGGHPLSAILIVDSAGAPLRQIRASGNLRLEDLALSDNGNLYAVGDIKVDGIRQAVLQRYRSGRY
ncbi:hypothetical protein [Breoghania sp.]|uniref:hypothetical protein n=1 Tax=Breoghania sp. TaxID=2065378 RepID=UPI002AA8DB17|nr:hypothetical protein [Breoghania sp.]